MLTLFIFYLSGLDKRGEAAPADQEKHVKFFFILNVNLVSLLLKQFSANEGLLLQKN